MSSPMKSDNAEKAPIYTNEGLPLNPVATAMATSATESGGGPARRIDCRPTQLPAAPALRPSSKMPVHEAQDSNALTLGPNNGSLIDDDDDDLMDYFGMACAGPASIAAAKSLLSSSQWNVQEQNVPTLPLFYPLERSATFVPQASAPNMAAQITTALQARSIDATFDAENAKVDCVSKTGVEFRIRLYRGRDKFSHGIIAEVQRRMGFDVSYSQDVFAILDAVEGKQC